MSGIAILTSEGFVGQRLIIDDYFVAGESLNAGDVVGIRQDFNYPYHPRVYRTNSSLDPKRIIGIVHTPPSKTVGDPIASLGELVPIVVHGVAKALTAGPIGVGDSVSPSRRVGSLYYSPGITDPLAYRPEDAVATVKATVNPDIEPVIGRCLTPATAPNRVVDVLVDIAGTFPHGTPSALAAGMESLGTLEYNSSLEFGNRYEDDQIHHGKYARCYGFTLAHATEVNIKIRPVFPSPSVSTAINDREPDDLFLVRGHDINGPIVQTGFLNYSGSIEIGPVALGPGTYTIVARSLNLAEFSMRISTKIPKPELVEASITRNRNLLVSWAVPSDLPIGITYRIGAHAPGIERLPIEAPIVLDVASSPALLMAPPDAYEIFVRAVGNDDQGMSGHSYATGSNFRRATFLLPPWDGQFNVGDLVTDGNLYGVIETTDYGWDGWYYTFLNQYGHASRLPESVLSHHTGQAPAYDIGAHVTNGTVHGVVTRRDHDIVWYYSFYDQTDILTRLPESDLSLVSAPTFVVGEHVTDGTNHGNISSREYDPSDDTWYYTFTGQDGTEQRVAESSLSYMATPSFVTGDHVTDGTSHGLVTFREWRLESSVWVVYYTFTDQDGTVLTLAESALSLYVLAGELPPPTDLQLAEGTNADEVVVSWTAPADASTGATYIIEYTSLAGSGSRVVTASPATISGLNEITLYTFRVATRTVAPDGTVSLSSYVSSIIVTPRVSPIFWRVTGGNVQFIGGVQVYAFAPKESFASGDLANELAKLEGGTWSMLSGSTTDISVATTNVGSGGVWETADAIVWGYTSDASD